MQKGLAIIGLLCCAVGVCRAGDAPQAWGNAVDTNAMCAGCSLAGGCWRHWGRRTLDCMAGAVE